MRGHATEVFAFSNSLRAAKYMPRTRSLYIHTIASFDLWMRDRGGAARDATVEDILDYTDALPFTYASRQRFVNAHKAFWRVHLRRPEPAPSTSVFCPKRPEQVYRGLEDGDEARAVIAAAATIDPRAAAGAALCYFAALRCTEAATLSRASDEGEQLDVMGKGAQPRKVPIVDELRDRLDICYRSGAPSTWVLPSQRSRTHVSATTLQTWIRLAGERAGLGRVTPHVLRYTAGGVMLDSTDDLYGTGKYLGHSKNSLSVTAGYTRRTRKRMIELSEKL